MPQKIISIIDIVAVRVRWLCILHLLYTRSESINRMCTFVEMQIQADSKSKVAAWKYIGSGNGSSSSSATVRKKRRLWRTLCPDLWSFEPKINRLRQNVEDYHCAEIQIIPNRGFRFVVLTLHTHAHIHTNTHVTKWSQYPRRRVLAAVVKVVMWSRGLTWRSQVGANPIPIPLPTNLALFGNKWNKTIYSIRGLIAGGGLKSEQGAEQ